MINTELDRQGLTWYSNGWKEDIETESRFRQFAFARGTAVVVGLNLAVLGFGFHTKASTYILESALFPVIGVKNHGHASQHSLDHVLVKGYSSLAMVPRTQTKALESTYRWTNSRCSVECRGSGISTSRVAAKVKNLVALMWREQPCLRLRCKVALSA